MLQEQINCCNLKPDNPVSLAITDHVRKPGLLKKMKQMFTKLKLFVLVFSLCVIGSQAQTTGPAFEGEVIYSNTFKSKNPKLKDKQLSAMLGSVHNYYIKNGDYKTVTNGMFAQWQLYINKENKIYNKMMSSDTVFWNNAAIHDDELLSSKVNKNAITILGYVCDELVMVFRSGTHRYYYSSKLPVNSKLFVNHKYGNYYNYVSRANAVPLKMIIEDVEFTMESIATKVEAKKFPATFFVLPPNTKTAQSLY